MREVYPRTSKATTLVVALSGILLIGTSAAAAFSATSGAGSTLSSTPVVICPGFGNDEIDYVEPLKQPRDVGLVSALERRGFDPDLISIIPVKRTDWLRVAGGLLDLDFYTGNAKPTGGGYGWYVDRLKKTVDMAHEESGGERVLLLGHSAGGWLARAAMGDGTWCPEGGIRTADRVRCLATVGAIHRTPEDASTCVTRGALGYTDSSYPGAYLSGEGIGYVSVGGDAIVGDNAKIAAVETTDADELYAARGEGSASRVAFTSYESVCGQGGVTGDGVVPLDWTRLEGARQIRLEGVVHSINEAGTTIPTDRWYGSEGIIDQWLPAVLEEAGIGEQTKSANKMGGLETIQRWAAEAIPW
uniref:GPI inositol-deacylase n=1 Tax=Odontella aurita TaxID=265563 RepID=A0A7S4K5P4_9STRA|mmetsp:Transcript_62214/g.183987  ORF Transcript_62214/g.183987 Transcript_62214/m.183987 type:complete len:359 (+) Transcript_62214:140-1216(+)